MTTEQELEKRRKTARLGRYGGTVLQLAGIVLMMLGLLYLFFDFADWDLKARTCLVLAAAVIAMIGGYLLENRTQKKYEKEYKTYVIGRAALGLFDDYEFLPEWGFPKKEVKSKGLIRIKYGYRSDTLLKGQYHDVGFARADFSMRQNRISDMRVKGYWTIFTFPKPFKSDLQVSCGFMQQESGIRQGLLVPKKERRHIITTGNEEFDREFTCSGQDTEEALSLLTPAVRRKLLSMRYMRRNAFVMGWVNQELHMIVINGTDTAPAPNKGKLDLGQALHQTQEELRVICEIIDDMMMSRSIFADYVMAEMENVMTSPHVIHDGTPQEEDYGIVSASEDYDITSVNEDYDIAPVNEDYDVDLPEEKYEMRGSN